jgi:hypothetical protein
MELTGLASSSVGSLSRESPSSAPSSMPPTIDLKGGVSGFTGGFSFKYVV